MADRLEQVNVSGCVGLEMMVILRLPTDWQKPVCQAMKVYVMGVSWQSMEAVSQMMVASVMVRDMELPRGLLLFLIVIGNFMMADVQVKKKDVLEIMVQFEQDITKEFENVMVIVGGVQYCRVGMMVSVITVVASIVVSARVQLRKAEVEVYMGYCWATLREEGFPRESAAEIVQNKEPLYLIGLAILLMVRLMGPVEFTVMIEEIILTLQDEMVDGDIDVTAVLVEIMRSFGSQMVTIRLRVASILREDDSTKVKVVFAANVVMELLRVKEWLLMVRVK